MSLKQVVLTRPFDRAQPLAQRLIDEGFEVLMLPALSIVPIGRDESMAKSITSSPASAEAQPAATTKTDGTHPDTGIGTSSHTDSHSTIPTAVDQYDAVVFVSRAAWQYYDAKWRSVTAPQTRKVQTQAAQTNKEQIAVDGDYEQKTSKHSSPAWPTGTIVACVGQATAQCIAQDLGCSLSEIVFPDDHQNQDSEALLTLLAPRLKPGSRVLLVRGETGRDWLADRLRGRSVRVTCLPVYRREPLPWQADQIDILCQWGGLGDWSVQVRRHAGEHVQVELEREGQSEIAGDLAAEASSAMSAFKPAAGIWLVTSAEGLVAIEAQFEAQGWFGHVGMCPEAVVIIHPRLEPLVRRWLDRWVDVTGGAERSVGSAGATGTTGTSGYNAINEANAAISTVPIIVAQPTDNAIFEALVALSAQSGNK